MAAVTAVEAYGWECPEEDEGPEIVVLVEARSTPEEALALGKAASTAMDHWARTQPQLWWSNTRQRRWCWLAGRRSGNAGQGTGTVGP